MTYLGATPCTNYRGELGASASCSDGSLTFYGLINHIDDNSLTAQFSYTFTSGSQPNASAISWCTFRPWETCNAAVTTVKVLITDEAAHADRPDDDEQHTIFRRHART